MRSNLFILNDDKTEDIHFLSRYLYEQLTSLRVGGSYSIPSNCIRNIVHFLCQVVSGGVSAHANQV